MKGARKEPAAAVIAYAFSLSYATAIDVSAERHAALPRCFQADAAITPFLFIASAAESAYAA